MVPTAFITARQSFLVNIFTQRRFHSPANERGVAYEYRTLLEDAYG